MRSKRLTLTPAAADADGICESQTPAAGGVQSLTIDGNLASGGVATIGAHPVGRPVRITAAADDSGRTFTITGTYDNRPQVETITGPNTTTADGLLPFDTVTSVTVDDDTAGAIQVGTSEVCLSPWISLNHYARDFAVGFGVDVSGTVNYTVEHTFDRLQIEKGETQPPTPNTQQHETVFSKTDTQDGNYAFPCEAIRLKINSFTAGASLDFSIHQAQ